MQNNQDSSLSRALASLVIGALLGVLLTDYAEHQRVIKTIRIVDCINVITASTLITGETGGGYDWNLRYLISPYHSGWNDIIRKYGPESMNTYVQVVMDMESSNILLNRLEGAPPSYKTVLLTTIAEVSKSASANFVKLLGVDKKECQLTNLR